ncbi:hypothetical protein ABIB25_000889 [Nakamurella sp. UYEF19]|uniref:hypothetical protein n=1 Tax=Nakamurella sp. UYEF19 TaxID=1756392 RepID=UPI003395D9CA
MPDGDVLDMAELADADADADTDTVADADADADADGRTVREGSAVGVIASSGTVLVQEQRRKKPAVRPCHPRRRALPRGVREVERVGLRTKVGPEVGIPQCAVGHWQGSKPCNDAAAGVEDVAGLDL